MSENMDSVHRNADYVPKTAYFGPKSATSRGFWAYIAVFFDKWQNFAVVANAEF